MSTSEISRALGPLADLFDALGVPYYIGGSVAGSLYGITRATLDIDLGAHITSGHIVPLCRGLEQRYYVSEQAVAQAVRRRTSFNLIHLETMVKVVVFVLGGRPFDHKALSRSRRERIDTGPDVPLFAFASAEDVILTKLDWYRRTDCTSRRQWDDIRAILSVQNGRLDNEYMHTSARELGVAELLDAAEKESEEQGCE